MDNQDTYSVFVRKSAVSDVKELSNFLAESLDMSFDFIYNRLTTTKSSEVTIKKQVPKSNIEKLIKGNYSGVYFSRDNSRTYPYNEFLTSVLGFTSTDGKGQSGLELYYDKYLSGVDGEILYETDIVGVEIGNSPSYIPAVNGLNLQLTIDFDVQMLCEKAMSDAMEIHQAKRAQMIVIDPSTGAIRGLCNKPSYNLNEIPRDNLDLLNSLSRNSLVSDVYEPGSTFKILTTAANIEEYLKGNKKAYSPNHIFSSSRYRYISGQKVKCWNNHQNGKHSNLDIQGGLNNSCNPIFVDMAMALGKDVLYEYINAFNYGSVTGLDFSGESQGMILPKSSVLDVDLARIAFGQTIAVTGVQLAAATSAAINGGVYFTPRLVEKIYDKNGIVAKTFEPVKKRRVISEKASSIINQMLEGVVSDGSGKQAYIEGYRVAGKTGTAQKYQDGHIAAGKYVSSFVGYFPANAPKYLALVIIDEPVGQYYGSTVAAPFAKTVFEGIILTKGLKPLG